MIASASYVVAIVTCTVNAIMSPVAVVGNGLILLVIWKNQSLRTTSYILLVGLAITDLLTGLIVLPFLVVSTVIEVNNQPTTSLCLLTGIFLYGISSYLSLVSIFIMTFMSIDRWLHMKRNSMITIKRVYKAIFVMYLLPIPLIAFRLVQSTDGCVFLRSDVAEGIVVLLCFLVTIFFYFKVFQIIRLHQNQIHVSQQTHNFGQPAIDIAKYKKSVITILYILGLFAICYLPSALFLIVMLFYPNFQFTAEVVMVTKILPSLYFLLSALNPLLYCWRMRYLRSKVTQLLVTICHQNAIDLS